jgi:hypothetical protein
MAPACIQHLAPELLDHILSYLIENDGLPDIRPSITDLLSVSRTSQRLRLHALPFIYRDIQLSDRSSLLRMTRLVRTFLNQPGLLEHTRTVCFEIQGSNVERRDPRLIDGRTTFTSHDSNLLASFMRRIGVEPRSMIWPHFLSFGMRSQGIYGITTPSHEIQDDRPGS